MIFPSKGQCLEYYNRYTTNRRHCEEELARFLQEEQQTIAKCFKVMDMIPEQWFESEKFGTTFFTLGQLLDGKALSDLQASTSFLAS